MPISPSELKEYKSANTNSDGGAIDLTRLIPSGGPNNLWPDITSVMAAAGGTDYRKVFRRNESAMGLTWSAVRSWIQQQPQNVTVSVGIGAASASDNDATQGNMTALGAPAQVYLASDGTDVRTATVLGDDGLGNHIAENVVLVSATPVHTVATFTKMYAVQMSATDAARTVTVREGSGGPIRGTIGPNKITCWLWRAQDLITSATAYTHGDIAVNSSFALWFRRAWNAGISSVLGTADIVRSDGGTPP